MTRSMLIKDGDLVLGGDSVQLVSGKDRLEQDLSIWLRERFGVDRFHPNYGSVLDNFVGGYIDLSSGMEVKAEVLRVLQNYQTLQAQNLRKNPGLYSPDELLDRIISVRVVQNYDAFEVTITYATLNGIVGTITHEQDAI